MAGSHTNTPNKPIPALSKKDLHRFWAKVDKRGPDECWPWTASVTYDGYGRFSLQPVPKSANSMFQANRVSYFIEHGVDPGDEGVLHHCDNPPCVNPAHLFLGSPDDNAKDSKRKGRRATGDRNGHRLHPERTARGERSGAHTHPESRPRGENHGRVKLTDRQVQEMVGLKRHGVPLRILAKHFGLSHTQTYVLSNGRKRPQSTIIEPEPDNPLLNPANWTRRDDGDLQWTRRQPERLLRGEASTACKFSTAIVLEVRRRYLAGETQGKLAKEFGMTKRNAKMIGRSISRKNG